MRPQNTATSSPTPAEAPAAPRADSLQALVAWITEATAPVVGEDFFQALIKLLATRIGVDTALLTQCPTSDREVAETLAFWHRGEFEPNVEFRLAGTPCEQVIHDGRFCFLPEGVSQRFPDWAREEGGVESFIGVPVTCPETGKVLGHIAVYDRNPMPRDAAAESMFRIIAMRAGAEIRRRQAERARMEQQQLAQRRLYELAAISRRASISQMASAVTHEIRQPLTQIKTYAQTALRLLDRQDSDIRQLRRALEQALNGSERGEAIINRLQRWMGNTEMRSETIVARELIEETSRLLAGELDRTGTTLTLDLSDTLPKTVGDKVLLQQVIFNLLRNSLEAIERNHKPDDRRSIDVRASCGEAETIVVEISDTGEGVPDTMAENIFEPLSGDGKAGMGIGLSLCQSIVASHGGALKLDSARDPTVFRITLLAFAQAQERDSYSAGKPGKNRAARRRLSTLLSTRRRRTGIGNAQDSAVDSPGQRLQRDRIESFGLSNHQHRRCNSQDAFHQRLAVTVDECMDLDRTRGRQLAQHQFERGQFLASGDARQHLQRMVGGRQFQRPAHHPIGRRRMIYNR